jgi:hypothetical protein
MSFQRTQKPTFRAKVTVPVPNDQGGHDINTFMADFKRTTTSELEAMREHSGLTDADLVRDRLVGWDMTDAETKQKVPFDSEELEAVLQIQPSPKYIAKAFWENVLGGKH